MKKIYAFMIICPGLTLILIILLVIVVCNESNTSASYVPIGSTEEFEAPFTRDVDYQITSDFGYRIDPIDETIDFHSGIDLWAKEGTKVVSSASGRVKQVGNSNSLGYYIIIEHDVGGEIYCTAYAHLKKGSVVVSESDLVGVQQVIAEIGSTGRVTGLHLHFMLMNSKCIFSYTELYDPRFIIDNDMKKRQLSLH